ncbi:MULTISPECIES: hypothetical protein [unclassified Streptomyces]|uniref:hypothetical protein n=1 Tax=unclassified Streptomyces TaxID=2593676 RepID=UPI002258C30D|nr:MULTISPECIES: hypothetical protein [unclassified Streptomyces]MCX4881847.1 hypothetical protein [Streptomyces sp. NBC_00847]MCX5421841.1 hypothetical protein [Streptomyces sp. NBC_00078]
MAAGEECSFPGVGNVVGVAQQEHRTTTVEQGRFCMARCSCGWRGPARRARSLARSDAEGHLSAY